MRFMMSLTVVLSLLIAPTSFATNATSCEAPLRFGSLYSLAHAVRLAFLIRSDNPKREQLHMGAVRALATMQMPPATERTLWSLAQSSPFQHVRVGAYRLPPVQSNDPNIQPHWLHALIYKHSLSDEDIADALQTEAGYSIGTYSKETRDLYFENLAKMPLQDEFQRTFLAPLDTYELATLLSFFETQVIADLQLRGTAGFSRAWEYLTQDWRDFPGGKNKDRTFDSILAQALALKTLSAREREILLNVALGK